MNKDTATLFLHGGPGLSAIAERALYGSELPIHWWDQPRSVVLYARPFGALLDAAEEEVTRLSASGRRVNLVAHSFGTHLALRLAMRMSERLGKIVLLAPVYDIGDAFVRLAHRLLEVTPTSQPLLGAVEEFRAGSDYSRFARLAAQIMSVANFLDVYWSPGADARRRWFLDLLTHQPVADLNAFEVIVRDFWSEAQIISVQTTVTNPVELIFGRADPLVDVEAERRIWTAFFPHAVSRELDSGHFVHLETEPTMWWTHG